MSPPINRQILLRRRPEAIPQAEDFEIRESPAPTPGEGEILVRNVFLSVEPAMRGWVSAVANYADPVPLGGVMRAFTVGRVATSRHPDFAAGDGVTGMLGWQDYAVSDGTGIRRIDHDLPISTAVGVLGLNGITAYLGLTEAGRPRAGETVVVSTAAGAVGSCVGQVAKILGCRTVGIGR